VLRRVMCEALRTCGLPCHLILRPSPSTFFPYTTLFRSEPVCRQVYALTVENRRSGRRIERLDRCAEIEVPRAVAEVEQAHPGLIAEAALVHQQRLIVVKGVHAAVDEHRLILTPGHEAAIDVEHRIGIGLLRGDRQRQVPVRQRQPGLLAAETTMPILIMPGHGRAAAVAPLEFGPETD